MLRAVGSTDATVGGGKSRKSGRGAGNSKGPNGGGGTISASAWDPLKKGANIASLSGGDLVATIGSEASAACAVLGTTSRTTSGVWQFEVTIGALSTNRVRVGISKSGVNYDAAPGNPDNNTIGWTTFNASYRGGTFSAYGAVWGAGAVIGVVFDAGAGTITFYKDGASQGVAYSGLAGEWFPAFGSDSSAIGATGTLNTGATAFAYPIGGATAWG